MTRELEQALALLFRRFREQDVAENDLVKVVSLTLNWAKPSQAPHLLARGAAAGLLDRTEGGYRARFDKNAVEVPFGFKPPAQLFESGGEEAGSATASPAVSHDEPATSARSPETKPPATPPESSASSTDPRPALEALLDAIAGARGGDRKDAVAVVNAKQQALDNFLTLDACALLVAAELGIDVGDFASDVLEGLKVGSG